VSCKDLDLVGATTDGQDVMRLCPHVQPDVVVVDSSEADVDGPALARRIHGRWPWVQVLVLGKVASAREVTPQEAAKGIDSLPDATWRNVEATIRALHEQRTRWPGWNGSGPPMRAFPDQALSQREWEVWRALRKGLSDAQIGERLAVYELTARFYVGNVLGHLGLASRQDVVTMDQPDGRRSRRLRMVASVPEKRGLAVGL
jgi:DNA-binding NarL/FixJ family response regulator